MDILKHEQQTVADSNCFLNFFNTVFDDMNSNWNLIIAQHFQVFLGGLGTVSIYSIQNLRDFPAENVTFSRSKNFPLTLTMANNYI